MASSELTTSAFRRFARLGSLMGRVGTSVLANHLLTLVGSDADRRRTENLVRNATRVAETLGELKGATMKLGQMLSLQDGLLPPEVAEVLRSLQKEAPPVPGEVMEYEIRGALPSFDELFETLDLEPFAAASIGQVHTGRLRDGRRVAVKIQYPCIDRIVKADLKNLRVLLKSLFAMFSTVDFAPVWREVRDRLLEELDYGHEAENLRKMTRLHANNPDVIIPGLVEEATTEHVLTMEYVDGIGPAEACSGGHPQKLRDRWGAVLFELLLRGLLKDRLLHADPNLANFSFRPDGRVVIYDFGCLKQVPIKLARGYGGLLQATAEEHRNEIPAILRRMGVSRPHGESVGMELVAPWYDVLAPIARSDPPFTFGADAGMYDRLFRIGLASWSQASDLTFPKGVVFINRTLAGHFGNLIRLRATGPWRNLILKYTAG